jgi:hypothetical protein
MIVRKPVVPVAELAAENPVRCYGCESVVGGYSALQAKRCTADSRRRDVWTWYHHWGDVVMGDQPKGTPLAPSWCPKLAELRRAS